MFKNTWFQRLTNGLKRTRQSFSDGLADLILGKKIIDAELFKSLETLLLTADLGVETTDFLIKKMTDRVNRKQLSDPAALTAVLKDEMISLLKPYEQEFTIIGEQSGLHIILDVHNGLDEEMLVEKAVQAKLKVYPLSAYSIEKPDKSVPKIILGFAGIPEKKLDQAISLLLEAWRN